MYEFALIQLIHLYDDSEKRFVQIKTKNIFFFIKIIWILMIHIYHQSIAMLSTVW